MPSSVPDVIYALASIAGDEGCSRWCAQEVYVNEQSYSTAEKRLTPQRKRSCWVPPSPRWASTATLLKMSRPSVILTMIVENKIGYILDYGPTVCHVIKLELASIKADSAAAAKLTDHVYCLLKVQTDMGRPNRPDICNGEPKLLSTRRVPRMPHANGFSNSKHSLIGRVMKTLATLRMHTTPRLIRMWFFTRDMELSGS